MDGSDIINEIKKDESKIADGIKNQRANWASTYIEPLRDAPTHKALVASASDLEAVINAQKVGCFNLTCDWQNQPNGPPPLSAEDFSSDKVLKKVLACFKFELSLFTFQYGPMDQNKENRKIQQFFRKAVWNQRIYGTVLSIARLQGTGATINDLMKATGAKRTTVVDAMQELLELKYCGRFKGNGEKGYRYYMADNVLRLSKKRILRLYGDFSKYSALPSFLRHLVVDWTQSVIDKGINENNTN